MRKYLFISLCTIFCLLFSLPVNAQEANRKIGEDYTTDGIHYTIYEEETTQILTRSVASSLYVSRNFVFDEYTIPPRQVEHHEINNGILYVGTLKLCSYRFSNNKYTANYQGTIYRISTYPY